MLLENVWFGTASGDFWSENGWISRPTLPDAYTETYPLPANRIILISCSAAASEPVEPNCRAIHTFTPISGKRLPLTVPFAYSFRLLENRHDLQSRILRGSAGSPYHLPQDAARVQDGQWTYAQFIKSGEPRVPASFWNLLS